MHFWGQSAWLRITFGDLVRESRRPRPSKPRGRPDHTPEQRQVDVLLLFVAPSDLSRVLRWGTLRLSATWRSRAGNAPMIAVGCGPSGDVPPRRPSLGPDTH